MGRGIGRSGLKAHCEKQGPLQVPSEGNCMDTGRNANMIHAISSALDGVLVPDLSGVTGELLNVGKNGGKAVWHAGLYRI